MSATTTLRCPTCAGSRIHPMADRALQTGLRVIDAETGVAVVPDVLVFEHAINGSPLNPGALLERADGRTVTVYDCRAVLRLPDDEPMWIGSGPPCANHGGAA